MSILRLFVLLTLLLLLGFLEFTVHGQSTDGEFISIACGRPNCTTFQSSSRHIKHICDDKFIDTGETHRLPDNVESEYSHVKYLRSFPEGTRNCFRIEPIKQNQKYLIRTSFNYANYDGKYKFPGFKLYLGIHFWDKVYGGSYSNDSYFTYEVMFMSFSESLSLCLANTNEGVPFISAIDLRPIPDNAYPEVNSSQSLVLANRIDFGGQNYVWYPDDKFDRLWLKESGKLSQSTTLESTSAIDTDNTSKWQYYQIPQVVMKTAAVPVTGSSLEFSYKTKLDELGVPTSNCYLTLYFAELEHLNSNESRRFCVYVNDIVISDAIQPKYLQISAFSSILHPKGSSLIFRLSSLDGSTKPPILNAMEFYCANNMTSTSETKIGDVNAITTIKKLYKLRRNWMGDPCVPKVMKWEGLDCTYQDFMTPRITSVNLSSSHLSGAIPSYFGNLTQLQQLDLSNNALTGRIPESLASLSQLNYLNLARNNLEGHIPKTLLERSTNHSLRLSVEGNPRLCTKQNSCLSRNDNVLQNVNEAKHHKAIIITVASTGSLVLLLLVLLIFIWKLKRRHNGPSSHLVDASTRLQTTDLEIKSFTYNELVSITNNFAKQIGHGGFGSVYYGIYTLDIQVAVKLRDYSSHQGYKEFHAELAVLKKVHHKNLVPFLGYCDDNNHLALLYEFMPGGSVADHLTGGFCWRDRIRIASEAAQGLEYLHEGCTPAIVHRDVKTSNILLTKNMEARIADFGLSRIQVDGVSLVATRVVGTPGYLDPEYFANNRLHEKSDVYSFGVVLMELITGKSAIFNASNGKNSLVTWVQERLEYGGIGEIIDGRLHDYNMNSIRKAMDTAIACCAFQSVRRPNMTEVLCHLKECLELEIKSENYRQQYSSNEFKQHSGSSTSIKFTSSSNSSFMNPISR